MSNELDDFIKYRLDVSRETIDRLCKFEDIVLKWNPKINLIAKSETNKIWIRHIHDSLRILSLLDSKNIYYKF